MTEDEVRAWRASLRPGARVGFRLGEYPHGEYLWAGTTMREYVQLREPDGRCWEISFDPIGEEHDIMLDPAGDRWLEPLPSPESVGMVHVGRPPEWARPFPPRKGRRAPARARRATA
jgi:hypothetical protein